MEHIDTVVVGAGVVGLAIARELCLKNRSVLVLEKNDHFGMSTSSRNSEVIHAGIYYPTNSLKAKFCVEGNRLLYEFLKERHLPFKRLGKLIVSCSSEEEGHLEKIWQQALSNGVPGMKKLSQQETKDMEPTLHFTQAIFSESTGIVDSHALMLTLLGDIENAGGNMVYRTELKEANQCQGKGRFQLRIGQVNHPEEDFELSCHHLINCAGLSAVEVAKKINGLSSEFIPESFFVKGNYFKIHQKVPFKHLIYPIPEKAGLGVHLTLDLQGSARFGPDVEHIPQERDQNINYTVNPNRAEHFAHQIKKYWPTISQEDLVPDYSGVRPKIKTHGEVFPDFKIDDVQQHQVEGLIQLFGIESPGLTAALAIAKDITDRIRD